MLNIIHYDHVQITFNSWWLLQCSENKIAKDGQCLLSHVYF